MMRASVAIALLLSVSAGAQELPRAGFLGLQVHSVDGGVEVQRIVDGGSAAGSGILAGDIVTHIDDQPAGTAEQFVDLARRLRAGDVAVLRIARAGETLVRRVTLKPRPVESSPDADVSYRAIAVDGSLRRVIVTAPKTAGRHPAILYVNGIGCFSQESLDRSSPDARLLYSLTAGGFVTMRVEKTSIGDSQGPPCSAPEADFNAEIRSYLAGLRALKQYPFVDPQRIFIVGLSIGGVEAPLLAGQEAVLGVVVVNTVSKPFLEYLLETRRRQMELRHLPYDDIDRQMMAEELCNHRLLIGKESPGHLVAENPDCRERVAYPAPYTFMQQWAAVTPASLWKSVSAPVLVVYGTSDFIATTADQPHLAAMINSFHPGKATLRAVEGMDHYLTTAATMEASMTRTTPGQFHDGIVEVIAEWMRSVVAAQPQF